MDQNDIRPTIRSGTAAPLLSTRDGHCRFIVSEHPAICCGAQITGTGSWCDKHRAIVFIDRAVGRPARQGPKIAHAA